MPVVKHELGDLAQSLDGHYAKINWMKEHIPAQMLLSEECQEIMEKELDLIVKMQQAAEKAEQIGGSKAWNQIETTMGKNNMDHVLLEAKKLDGRDVVKNGKEKTSKSICGRIFDVVIGLVILYFILMFLSVYAKTDGTKDYLHDDDVWKELKKSLKSRG